MQSKPICNSPLISIIVPVYNISKYLPKCIDTILAQSYRNLEIILVDDGSTDDSGGICDGYRDRDARIQVIHKTNKGLSSARNAGLSAMQGQYVGFVDGDDFIDKHMYDTLVKAALDSDADVVQTGYYHTDENGNIRDTNTFKEASYNNLDDMFHAFFEEGNIHVGVWTKLYRSTIFEHITFFEGYVFEDYTILPHILKECRKFVIIDGAFYHYVHNFKSITRAGPSLIVIKSRVVAPIYLVSSMRRIDSRYIGYAYRYVCLSSMRGYDAIKRADNIDEESKKEYETKLINHYRNYFHLYRKEAQFKNHNLFRRINLYIFWINPYFGHSVLHSYEKVIGISNKIIARVSSISANVSKPAHPYETDQTAQFSRQGP